jgi:hypothetical protein
MVGIEQKTVGARQEYCWDCATFFANEQCGDTQRYVLCRQPSVFS